MAKRLVLSFAETCSLVISLCLPFLMCFDLACLVSVVGGAFSSSAFVVNFSLPFPFAALPD